jgi:hypothetical protein
MPIDADLILRHASEVQRVQLERARAAELAEEAQSLFDSALLAGERAQFDDDPDRFVRLLWELRDQH